jgi:hypothetical protein
VGLKPQSSVQFRPSSAALGQASPGESGRVAGKASHPFGTSPHPAPTTPTTSSSTPTRIQTLIFLLVFRRSQTAAPTAHTAQNAIIHQGVIVNS